MRFVVAVVLVALAAAIAFGKLRDVGPGDPHAALRDEIRRVEYEIAAIDRQREGVAAMEKGAWKRGDEGKFRQIERLGADEGALRDRRRRFEDEAAALRRDLCGREGIVACARNGDGPAGRAVALVVAAALVLVAAFVWRPRRWFEA